MKTLITHNLQLTTPTHIAVIMDGNRRWARERNLPVLAGHQKVANEVLETLIEHAASCGIKYMTFWAWSTENWQRDKREVEGIMRLFRDVIARRWKKLHEKGVRINIIGDISKFASDIQDSLKKVIEQTRNNTKITVTLALNYGGRDEVMRAINKMYQNYSSSEAENRVEKSEVDSSRLRSNNKIITKEQFSQFLDTAGIPDPDLIVRPGGEKRLSGFLLWQSEYSELYFADWMMPEFTPEKLDEILEDFVKRKRRFGK